MQKTDRKTIIEEEIQKRLDYGSIRVVAEACGIPELTLRGRMSRQEIHESKKIQQLNLEILDFPNPHANHDYVGACSDRAYPVFLLALDQLSPLPLM